MEDYQFNVHSIDLESELMHSGVEDFRQVNCDGFFVPRPVASSIEAVTEETLTAKGDDDGDLASVGGSSVGSRPIFYNTKEEPVGEILSSEDRVEKKDKTLLTTSTSSRRVTVDLEQKDEPIVQYNPSAFDESFQQPQKPSALKAREPLRDRSNLPGARSGNTGMVKKPVATTSTAVTRPVQQRGASPRPVQISKPQVNASTTSQASARARPSTGGVMRPRTPASQANPPAASTASQQHTTSSSVGGFRVKTQSEVAASSRGRTPGYLTPTQASSCKTRPKSPSLQGAPQPRPSSPKPALTVPKTPHLSKSRRRETSGPLISSTTRQLQQVQEHFKQRENEIARRNEQLARVSRIGAASGSSRAPVLTRPQPFNLQTESRAPHRPLSPALTYRSTAEIASQITAREKYAPPPPKTVQRHSVGGASDAMLQGRSPALRTEERHRTPRYKTSAEIEYERVQQEKALMAQQRAQRKSRRSVTMARDKSMQHQQ